MSAPARNASASVVSSWARPSRRTVERGLSILSPLVLLAIWEAGAIVGVVDTRFFPAPSTIFAALATLLQAGELQEHLLISLERIAVGFVLGAVPGIRFGLAFCEASGKRLVRWSVMTSPPSPSRVITPWPLAPAILS